MSKESPSGRSDSPLRAIRFGAFELDVRAGELRKHGIRIRLQEQPFQVLLMLLERPGEVVLREEIRKKLWPNDTIVEFAPSINAAIQRLRDALTDSADEPRYVETVARRGYRFIGELIEEPKEQPTPSPPSPAQPCADESSPDIRDLSARTIAHYRVLEKLGRGGMGEVYRARDTKLGRDVALKLLPEEFADDADRVARLEREAQVLASLNHPNIGAIYGMEEPNGIRALVMDLVDGPTLADRIAQGAIPIEEALGIARQIADALQTAHDKGIVHRDLKPANVKITPQGLVKVLDFGLASVMQRAGHTDEQEDSRTGVILGTAAYMSPEQARGQDVDKRADIWSFGVVLYEMLTGNRPFGGDTITETLAAVVSEEPEWERVPARAQRLLRSCLQKDLAQRLRDIGDAQLLLGDASRAAAAPRRMLPWAATAALTLIAAVALWALWRSTRTVERSLVRLNVDLGSQVFLPSVSDWAGNVVLSPDGTRLVFVSGNPRRLYTRRLDQSKASELAGTDGAEAPFFSPDGQWVGFFTGSNAGKLNKISVEGGAVFPLADVGTSAGGSWGVDGNIVLGGQFTQGLVRVPASGGVPTKILDLAHGELMYASPQILPGGNAVLFVDLRMSDTNAASIEVVSLADLRKKTLVRGGTFARYLPTGHLVYINNGKLFAIPFDVDQLETRGTPVSILDDVASMPQFGAADLDVAANGTLVYRSSAGGGGGLGTIQWVDGSGRKEPLLATLRAYANVWISPDGRRVSFVVSEGANEDVWVYDIDRDAMTRLTFGREPSASPVWTPDGRYIVFSALGKGIYWTRADGAGQPQPLSQSKNFQLPFSITRDGKWLAYVESVGNQQIWTLALEQQDGQLKAGKREQFLKSQYADFDPAFSPDGHWLAYTSNESGKYEVYVRPFPAAASGQGGRWQISNGGGRSPLWSRVEHELLYQAGQGFGELMTVKYTVNGDSFVPEKPRVRFEKLPGSDFDLAPDGQRVAVITPLDTPDALKDEHELTFLFNFFDELRRRVPVGGK